MAFTFPASEGPPTVSRMWSAGRTHVVSPRRLILTWYLPNQPLRRCRALHEGDAEHLAIKALAHVSSNDARSRWAEGRDAGHHPLVGQLYAAAGGGRIDQADSGVVRGLCFADRLSGEGRQGRGAVGC